MSPPRRGLHRQLATSMVLFVIVLSALYSLYTAFFVYAVEDAYFTRQLQQEEAALQQHFAATGLWAEPRHPAITLHRSLSTLPAPVRERLRDEPERVEFAGEAGRHYHLLKLSPARFEPGWLLYDATGQLLVRPLRDPILQLLAGTTVIAIVLAVLLSLVIVRRLTRPLSELAARVGTLDPARLPAQWSTIGTGDEVATLSLGFEKLIVRLQHFVARERSFARDASHELRTPLAVIRLAAEQLLQQGQLPAASAAHAHRIQESASRLERLIQSLLVLAREEHALSTAQRIRLLPLLERVILDQSTHLGDKPVQVEVEVPAETTVIADSAALQIIVSNLVGNAFAHTTQGQVRIIVQDAQLLIRNPADREMQVVLDGGELFRKAAHSQGFGLGLAIAHRLSERQGWRLQITVEEGDVVACLQMEAVALV